MKKLAMVPAAVLVLLPMLAIYTDGGFRAEATAYPWVRPAVVASPEFATERLTEVEPVVAAAPVEQTAPRVESPTTWAKASLLAGAVNRAMADFPGSYSVAVQDLQTGDRWVLGAEDRYHPASTIKMPVTLFALEQLRAGLLKWSDGIEYTEADFESPGGGAFETSPFGGFYPVENLVDRALKYSNNVAVNMLGRHLGWNNIRAWSRGIGGELYRAEDGSPEVSVLSELGWWLHLDRVSREDPVRAALVLNPLRQVAYAGRIAAGLPADVPHLHKFGSYNGYFHDGGVVLNDRPYALVVLTHGAQEHEADAAIAKASAAVFQVMSAR